MTRISTLWLGRFKKDQGKYWYARTSLSLFLYAPNFEKFDRAYCFWFVHPLFLLYIMPFLMPSVIFELCMQGLEISCMNSFWKNSWPVFLFFLEDYSFKKSGHNLVSEISPKLFELELWYLACWLGTADWGWDVHCLVKFKANSI